MSEENTEVNSEEIEINLAFSQSVEAGKSEDEVKMAMIGAGATFKNVTRLFNALMVDAGLAVSKEEKAEIVDKAVNGKDVSTEEGFAKAVNAITKKAPNVNEKSASALVRSYAKANEMECYSKPKTAGVARVGFKSRFYDALVANPAMTKEECSKYLAEAEGTSANILKHESNYQGVRDLANRIHAS